MKVSVIVPAYNEESYIGECLKCLVKQKEKADEIIVVNNNSIDNTVKIAKIFPVRVISEKKQGMIYSRNKGFNAAKFDIIARTDADTRVPNDWIKRIKNKFQNEELIALSGPSRFYEIPSFAATSTWPTRFFFRSFKKVLKHDCLYGPNMAIRKSAWEQVKDDVCLQDSVVHEDIDLTIHLARYGKIQFDTLLVVDSSLRRWRRLDSYFDYPYRSFLTIRHHKLSPFRFEKSRRLTKYVLSKKLFKIQILHTLLQNGKSR